MSLTGSTILVTVFLPPLVLIWAGCLIICLYKHLMLRLEKNMTRTGQCASVTVVVENNKLSQAPASGLKQPVTRQQPVISSQCAPVTSHLASSLTMADFIKSDIDLNASLGPLFYPKAPISTIPEPLAREELFPSPMAPLVPPWPHLPPISSAANEKTGSSRGPRSLNASFNNRVNFLSNQILNPQNHTQQQQPND